MRDLDVVVVGGGLAGLTAAAFAGRAGLSVGVFERAASLGGRAQTQEKDGFFFNLGPHALYRGGEASAALRELGVPVRGGVPPVGAFSMMTTGLLSFSAKVEAGRILTALGRLRTMPYDRVSQAEWLRAEIRPR